MLLTCCCGCRCRHFLLIGGRRRRSGSEWKQHGSSKRQEDAEERSISWRAQPERDETRRSCREMEFRDRETEQNAERQSSRLATTRNRSPILLTCRQKVAGYFHRSYPSYCCEPLCRRRNPQSRNNPTTSTGAAAGAGTSASLLRSATRYPRSAIMPHASVVCRPLLSVDNRQNDICYCIMLLHSPPPQPTTSTETGMNFLSPYRTPSASSDARRLHPQPALTSSSARLIGYSQRTD